MPAGKVDLIVITTIIVLFAYLVFRLIKPAGPKRINTKVLESFPEIQVDFTELAEKTWLRFNDEMYRRYVEALEKINPKDEPEVITITPDSSTEKTNSHVKTTKTSDIKDLHDEILISLWNDCIKPYLPLIEEQNALDIIKEGLRILQEKGNCPSVSVQTKELSASDEVDVKEYEIYKNILSEVTLKDHTVHVVRYAINNLKSTFQEPDTHAPKILVCTIYHDIGKIPEYRSIYGNLAHPFISGNILSQVSKKFEKIPFWIDEAIQIVKNHHLPGEQNVYKKILKEADKSARMLEISLKLSGFTVKNFSDWFSIEEFLKKLAPLVNDDRFGNKWYAFSFNNVVYLRPDRLIDLLESMREEKKLIVPELFSSEDREKIKLKIISELSEKDLLAYSTREKPVKKPITFVIMLRDGRSFKFNLIPIKITAFSEEDIKMIEGKRHVSTLTSSIAEVQPAK